jgi:AsmA-like C-terminal region
LNYKKILYWTVLWLVLVAGFLFTYNFFKKIDYNQLAVNFLKNLIQDKLNGSIEFENMRLGISSKRLVFKLNSITLLDDQGMIVIKAINPKLTWSTKNLFTLTPVFKNVSMDRLDLYFRKTITGEWNYEKLLIDKKRKPLSIKVDELDIPTCNINVSQYAGHQYFDHSLKIYLKKLSRQEGKGYLVDIISKNLLSTSSSLASNSFEDYENSGLKNLVKISGILGVAEGDSWQGMLENSKHLYLDFYDINDLNIELLANLLFTNSQAYYRRYFRKYSQSAKVFLHAHLDDIKNSSSKDCQLKLQFINYAAIPKIKFDAKLILGQNLVFQNCSLIFNSTLISLNGDLKKWRNSNPGLDLNLVFSNLNFEYLQEKIPDLKSVIPSFVMQIFSMVHNSKYFSGTLKIENTLKAPQLILEMPLVNSYTINNRKSQFLKTQLNYSPKELVITSFEIPVDFSKLSMQGKYVFQSKNLDLNIQAEDLSLEKVKPVISEMPFLLKFKDITDNITVQGYTSLLARITNIPALKNDKNVFPEPSADDYAFRVKSKLAGVSFAYKNYPLSCNKLNADLELGNNFLRLLNLNAYLDGDYIEARGRLNLKDFKKLSIEFASPSLKANTIVQSKILDLFQNKKVVLNRGLGLLKDVYINFGKQAEDWNLSGKLNFDDVDLRINDKFEFHDIRGLTILTNKSLKLVNFSAFLGNDSTIKATGIYNLTGNGTDMKLVGQKVQLVDLVAIIDPGRTYRLDPRGGSLDFDLLLKNKNISGKFDLDKVAFVYNGSNYIKYPFVDLVGQVEFNKNFAVSNLSGSYGSSLFQNLNANLKNPNSNSDKYLDLSCQANILTDEFYDLIPVSIQRYLKMKGYMPVKIIYSGNKLKKNLTLDADLEGLAYFKFADWLDLSKKYKAKIKSKILITPELIASDDTKIIFSDSITGLSSVIKSVFQVKDWSKTSDLNYFMNFSTPVENSPLSLLEPSIFSLRPLNLDVGNGKFFCDIYGTYYNRQTVCDFKIKNAVAKKYGIGDLKASQIDVSLLSIVNKPLDLEVAIDNGDWNTIPYKNLNFDLRVNGDYVYVNDLEAKVASGKAFAKTIFNYKTLESSFSVTGHKIPAHDFVQGVWGLGSEVPEGFISGTFEGKTQGVLPDPMFYNLEGTANVIVKSGKLSSLKYMQKILTAVNTLRNFDINNVFQILVTYKGGYFSHFMTALKYDHGKISTDRALLKAEQIELDLNGYVDFKSDQLWISGKGVIPRHSKSILQTVGLGSANLGNLLSKVSPGTDKEKSFFEFQMIGPVIDMNKSVESLKSNFKWL